MPLPALLAEAYLHRLDETLFTLGPIEIRWYGLSYLAGFFVGWWILRRLAATGRIALDKEGVGDLMFYAIAGVIVGGRLGYVLFYSPALLVSFGGDFPFWGVLALNQGGMSSHGGVAGVILAFILFARVRGVSSLHVLDLASFAAPPGLFFGRVANFINAELWGKVLPGPMQDNPPWWSVKYPTEIVEVWLRATEASRLPEDLLRRLGSALQVPRGLPLDQLRARVEEAGHHHLAALEPLRRVVPAGDGFHRNVIRAAYEGDPRVIEHLRPLLTAYHPSQLIQAFTDGPLLMAVLVLVWLKPRKPGVVGAWFMGTYGVLRLLTEEFFRQPDEGVEVILGLQRGQWLSIPMVFTGIIGLAVVTRREAPRLGGLRPVATASPAA